MAISKDLEKVQGLISNLPLEDILSGAEMLVNVPKVGPIIKPIIRILRMLVVAKPYASTAISSLASLTSSTEAVQKSNDNSTKDTFKKLLEIAVSDGIITNDEKNFLHEYALKAGFTEAQFEQIVKEKKLL